ncbi:MAG: glycosyltransferase family A protein, partial [Sedimenticola sp.]
MQISVIIPTHNRADLLERALKSVQAQTLPPLEVIVVDDGSEDHTREMVSEKFPRVHYLHQPNRGVSSARNLGISEARGDWIALLDSDDEWLPSKLASQKTRLESQPGHHICHTEEIWIRNGKRVNQMKKHTKQGGAIFQHCLPLCVISPSSVLIHKSVFREVGLFDESLPACEDYDLWLRICARYPVTYVEQPQIVKYGGHEDQLSRR